MSFYIVFPICLVLAKKSNIHNCLVNVNCKIFALPLFFLFSVKIIYKPLSNLTNNIYLSGHVCIKNKKYVLAMDLNYYGFV